MEGSVGPQFIGEKLGDSQGGTVEVLNMMELIQQVRHRLLTTQGRQKSYADIYHFELEF